MQSDIHVEIWRGTELPGSFQLYRVPRKAKQTILDLVTYVQRELDPSLAYRYSCRVGMCGTCAMVVNGRPRWTCRTQASLFENDAVVRIAPLRNFPVVKDLAVNMDPFFDKWSAAGQGFESAVADSDQFAPIRPASKKRRAANAGIECIGCGVCYSACDVVRWKSDFLGPAALNRTWTLVNDERMANPQNLINSVASDSGCLACHSTQSCTQFCPKQLDPSSSIASLKQAVARGALF